MENVRGVGEVGRCKMEDVRVVAHVSIRGVRRTSNVRGTLYVRHKGVYSTVDNLNE